MDPRISVVIPVYNASEYLAQCISSVLEQTERNIEVICVNDRSTDSSASILRAFAEQDNRLKLIEAEGQGAGAARNIGMKHARGMYLCFLDADDFFEPEMLQESADKMDAEKSDIAVFGSWAYDTARGSDRQAKWNLRIDLLPNSSPFSWKDMPDDIFNAFGNYTWNKMFRHSFIKTEKIVFQEISRTNDLLFTCHALITARRIVVLNKPFTHYRINSATSLQATNDRDPLAFLQAFFALYDLLKQQNVYKQVENSFISHLVDGIVSNVDSLHTAESLELVRAAIATEVEPRFTIAEHEKRFKGNKSQLIQYKDFLTCDTVEYCIRRLTAQRKHQEDLNWHIDWDEWRLWLAEKQIKELHQQLEETDALLRKTSNRLHSLESSWGYRMGEMIVSPIRQIRKLFLK